MAIEFEPGLQRLIGKKRSEKLGDFINHNYRTNFIRVIKGPEYFILKDNAFLISHGKFHQTLVKWDYR